MKKPGVFLRASIGIIILYLLIYKIDFNEVSKAISSLGIIVVFLFMLKYLFEKIMGAVNVKILFNALGDKISFLKLFMYSLVSYSLGLFSANKQCISNIYPALACNICIRLLLIFKKHKKACQKAYFREILQ